MWGAQRLPDRRAHTPEEASSGKASSGRAGALHSGFWSSSGTGKEEGMQMRFAGLPASCKIHSQLATSGEWHTARHVRRMTTPVDAASIRSIYLFIFWFIYLFINCISLSFFLQKWWWNGLSKGQQKLECSKIHSNLLVRKMQHICAALSKSLLIMSSGRCGEFHVPGMKHLPEADIGFVLKISEK